MPVLQIYFRFLPTLHFVSVLPMFGDLTCRSMPAAARLQNLHGFRFLLKTYVKTCQQYILDLPFFLSVFKSHFIFGNWIYEEGNPLPLLMFQCGNLYSQASIVLKQPLSLPSSLLSRGEEMMDLTKKSLGESPAPAYYIPSISLSLSLPTLPSPPPTFCIPGISLHPLWEKVPAEPWKSTDMLA